MIGTTELKIIIQKYKDIIQNNNTFVKTLKGGTIEEQNDLALEQFIKLNERLLGVGYELDKYKANVTSYLKDIQIILTSYVEFDSYLDNKNKFLREIHEEKRKIKPSYKFTEIKQKFEEYKRNYDENTGKPGKDKDLETEFNITSGVYYGIKKEIENKKIKEDEAIVVIDFGRKYTILSLLFFIAKLF